MLCRSLANCASCLAVQSTQKCGQHASKQLYGQRPGDNTDDTAGHGQLFERIHYQGVTDQSIATSSPAWTNINNDGLLNLVTQNGSKPGLQWTINHGCFEFDNQTIDIVRDPAKSQASIPGNPASAKYTGAYHQWLWMHSLVLAVQFRMPNRSRL